jgi:2'-5' RNA ligase
VSNWVRLLDAYTGPAWTADRIELVASHLGEGPGRRPRYETVAAIPLSHSAAPGRRIVVTGVTPSAAEP